MDSSEGIGLSIGRFVIIVLLLMSMTSFVFAEINSFGSFKQDTDVTVKQTCASCTYVNASIFYPNSTLAVTNVGMIDQGGGTWTYLFNDTRAQGRYDITGSGDLEGVPTSFDVLYFDINEYGIAASLFAMYTFFYIILLFFTYLFYYKFATNNGGKIRDPNFLFWVGFFDMVLFVIIEIYGFGGVDTLIVDIIKLVCLASGIYFWTMGVIGVTNWKSK